jgi:hypothetical protein
MAGTQRDGTTDVRSGGIHTMERPKPVVDYSSPAEERTRGRKAEDERREAIERYNESTFGERRPIASAFLTLAVFVVVVSAVSWFLPPKVGRPLAWVTVMAFVVWEWRKAGWPSGGGSSLWRPWRWW